MDTLLYNATVHTIAPSRSAVTPTAVAIKDGRIQRVGTTAALRAEASAHTRKIDLAGRTLLPGFCDAHAHIWKIGHLLTSMLDLRKITSLVELADKLRAFDAKLPEGSWLLGRGFNEADLAEHRLPTRADLDRVVPNRPVALTRTCGHIIVANSAALTAAGITANTTAPAGGVIDCDALGRPIGILRETAMGLITAAMPATTPAEYESMITAALHHQLALGITSTSDCGVNAQLLQLYRQMDAAQKLHARVNVMPLRWPDGLAAPPPLPQRSLSPRLRVDTVKFLADGGLSGATAALSEPYRHQNSQGVLRFEENILRDLCLEAHAAGWRIATHAIGDVTIDQVLRIYQGLGAGRHHRIEHFGLPTQQHLQRAAALGVISVPQSIFISKLGRNFREVLPESFLPRTYPIRAMLAAGLTVALSSDSPVVEDDNPLSGMQAAILRIDNGGQALAPEQSITIAEALYAYTMAGAIAAGDAKNTGTIEAGKRADLVVLNADPLHTDPAALTDIKVGMTFLDGAVVYEN
jgi:predicted amidohydrolase YtcJ